MNLYLGFIVASELFVARCCLSAFVKYDRVDVVPSSFTSTSVAQPSISEIHCVVLCENSDSCSAISYEKKTKTCNMGLKSKTVVADPSTSNKLKIYHKPGNFKLLVAAGSSFSVIHDAVNVVDLESSLTKCNMLPPYPAKVYGAAGVLLNQNQPFICGGSNLSPNCYLLINQVWTPSYQMVNGRTQFAISPPVFGNPSHLLFLTGGYISSGNTALAEVLTTSGWEAFSPSLPMTILNHCMIEFQGKALVIGGYQNGNSPGALTFFISQANRVWSPGPSLTKARFTHACAKIYTNSNSRQFSIIVTGGNNGGALNSVEVLDDISSQWRAGPILPNVVERHGLVEDSSGGVILFGGPYSTSIYQLPNVDPSSQWKILRQTLPAINTFFTSFLIPDYITSCSFQ